MLGTMWGMHTKETIWQHSLQRVWPRAWQAHMWGKHPNVALFEAILCNRHAQSITWSELCSNVQPAGMSCRKDLHTALNCSAKQGIPSYGPEPYREHHATPSWTSERHAGSSPTLGWGDTYVRTTYTHTRGEEPKWFPKLTVCLTACSWPLYSTTQDTVKRECTYVCNSTYVYPHIQR